MSAACLPFHHAAVGLRDGSRTRTNARYKRAASACCAHSESDPQASLEPALCPRSNRGASPCATRGYITSARSLCSSAPAPTLQTTPPLWPAGSQEPTASTRRTACPVERNCTEHTQARRSSVHARACCPSDPRSCAASSRRSTHKAARSTPARTHASDHSVAHDACRSCVRPRRSTDPPSAREREVAVPRASVLRALSYNRGTQNAYSSSHSHGASYRSRVRDPSPHHTWNRSLSPTPSSPWRGSRTPKLLRALPPQGSESAIPPSRGGRGESRTRPPVRAPASETGVSTKLHHAAESLAAGDIRCTRLSGACTHPGAAKQSAQQKARGGVDDPHDV